MARNPARRAMKSRPPTRKKSLKKMMMKKSPQHRKMNPMELRLSVYLSRTGVASRRGADKVIKDGCVTINGQVIKTPSTRVIIDKDHVKVNGKRVGKIAPPVYLMLNKPIGCVTTTNDPQGRPTVFDLLTRVKTMVEPIGRLDYDSEGLLLFTNDGDLANKLMSPSSKVPKTYKIKVRGHPLKETYEKLRKGVRLDGKMTKPAKVKSIKRTDNYTWLRITIVEGKYRQVRRMLKIVGHPVARLKREVYGSLDLEDLTPGHFRYLRKNEIDKLRKAVS